jgi:hypothetical protein
MKYTILELPNYTYDPHNTDVDSSIFQAAIDNGYTSLMVADIHHQMFMDKFFPEGWTQEEMDSMDKDHESQQ